MTRIKLKEVYSKDLEDNGEIVGIKRSIFKQPWSSTCSHARKQSHRITMI